MFKTQLTSILSRNTHELYLFLLSNAALCHEQPPNQKVKYFHFQSSAVSLLDCPQRSSHNKISLSVCQRKERNVSPPFSHSTQDLMKIQNHRNQDNYFKILRYTVTQWKKPFNSLYIWYKLNDYSRL